jgi:uncharacterized protein
MSKDQASGIIENLYRDLEAGDEITVAFQGGEPVLAGLSWFEHFIEGMESRRGKVKVNYALQTNGLLIDTDWAEFLHANNFLTGLSLDLLERFHDANRQDVTGQGTWERCRKAQNFLEEANAQYNILTVLTNEIAAEPDKVWNAIRRENIRFIQFIPCLNEMDSDSFSPLTLRPSRFASFYTRLYRHWLEELEGGNHISVKLFDDTMDIFFRGIPSVCGSGGHCHVQFVVEADGSVYPCDFYVLDQYRIGNLTQETLSEIFNHPVMGAFIKGEEPAAFCDSCPYFRFCGGGCKRMRGTMYYQPPSPICGYRLFLDKCLPSMEQAARPFFEAGGL